MFGDDAVRVQAASARIGTDAVDAGVAYGTVIVSGAGHVDEAARDATAGGVADVSVGTSTGGGLHWQNFQERASFWERRIM
jgi:hypothetical protein